MSTSSKPLAVVTGASDGLGLALGERGGPGLIRAGAESCAVSASFEVGGRHPVRALLAESEIAVEPDEALVLRRSIGRDGRSRAFVNDQAVGVALLRRLGSLLVEVQGQHEQMGLADPATHRALLDGWRRQGTRSRRRRGKRNGSV